MFFNDVHIMVYVAFGILGLIVGNILPHINKRLIEHKRVFDKSFFTEYPKNFEPHYIHMILIAVIYELYFIESLVLYFSAISLILFPP